MESMGITTSPGWLRRPALAWKPLGSTNASGLFIAYE
jgi:hypothetical protein